jgi:hypothetical protein
MRVTLITYTNFTHAHRHVFTLRCHPTAGTLPLAGRVCADIDRHPVAMLDPPAYPVGCSPPAGSDEVKIDAWLGKRHTTIGPDVPGCDMSAGLALDVYFDAITRKPNWMKRAERLLHCAEEPALLAKPFPAKGYDACMHG